MAAAPGAGKDGAAVVPRLTSRAELVRRWEELIDSEGNEAATEQFIAMLLRDARDDEYAQHAPEEEEEERQRVFEPWQPAPPGSALPPPPVERTVVMGLRAPPHLLPRKHETPPPTPAGLEGPVEPDTKKTHAV